MQHPLHPSLVHFPIACWPLAVLADFASLHFGEVAWRWSAGLLAVGCSMALLAMLAGFVELSKVPEGPPLRDTYWHMSLMFAAFTLFSVRLLLGQEQFQPIAPNLTLLCVDVIALVCLVVGGWLGGRLVYEHGVGRT